MILQLNQPLPVEIPQGKAWAHFLLDYSQDHFPIFGCFLHETGECWWVESHEVRLQKNWTLGRR
jgi:hypothetical protein